MAAATDPIPGLADRLRASTRLLHGEAERSGVVGDLLRGRVSRRGYALLLRNLLPAYEQLETGLGLRRERPGFAAIADPGVYRSKAIRADLEALCGVAWRDALPLLPSGRRYARRVARAASGSGAELIAHAYTRYLGDLFGGAIVRRRLGACLGLGDDALVFYDYPQIEDLAAFRRCYRGAFDAAGAYVDAARVAAEARVAFRLNIDVSWDVQRAFEDAARASGPS